MVSRRRRPERAARSVVLGGDGGALRQRAGPVPALCMGTHPPTQGAAGPASEGLRSAGEEIYIKDEIYINCSGRLSRSLFVGLSRLKYKNYIKILYF